MSLKNDCRKSGLSACVFRFRLPAVFTVVGLLSGCGTFGDLFTPEVHPERVERYRAAVESGRTGLIESAAESAAGREDSASGMLYTLESARLYSLAGDLERSIAMYQKAADRFEEERQQPLVQVSQGFFGAAALATSDRALPYESAVHERLMAHNFLALDHLRQGNLDFALIALNAAEAEQSYLRDKYAHLQETTAQTVQQAPVDAASLSNAYRSETARLQGGTNVALQPYQNALTHYLSAVLFSIRGDRDRSAIAMRAAAALNPSNGYIAAALQDGLRSGAGDALIVICLADGWVPSKRAVRIPFYWRGVILQVAVPTYGESLNRRWPAKLMIDGASALETEPLVDLAAQARQELADSYPRIFVRQVLRLIAKFQIQKELEEEHPLAGFAAQVFNLLTDQADERSWLTLPAQIGIAHLALDPGVHTIGLSPQSAQAFELPAGSTLFLILNRSGQSLAGDWALFDSQGQALQTGPLFTANSRNP